MTRLPLAALLSCIALSAAPVAAPAQGGGDAPLTQDQIVERFEAQKTRGLAIAPASNGSTSAASAAGQTQGTEVAYNPVPQGVEVNINISFDFDSAALREDQKPKLDNLCGAMNEIEDEVFRILGHTDSAGSAEYNQRLSKLRAEEVKRYLVSDCGIAPERLKAEGVGEQFLKDPENPRADVNRRVEFQVLG